MQRQVINAVFQRHNPAIQQVARPHLLPAKIIDQQDAAVGFHLEWRLVEAVDVVEDQVQPAQG